MKKIIMGLLLLFTFVLVGCQNEQVLSKPDNLFYDGALTWDEVENAKEYLITVNGSKYVREVAFLEITEEGTYQIEIFARAMDYKDSPKVQYILEIDYDQEADLNLRTENNILKWDNISQATRYILSYQVSQSDEQSFVTITDSNQYDLNFLPAGEITLAVHAVFPDGSKTEIFEIVYNK